MRASNIVFYITAVSTVPARDGACMLRVLTFWRLAEGREEEKMEPSGFTKWCRAQEGKSTHSLNVDVNLLGM